MVIILGTSNILLYHYYTVWGVHLLGGSGDLVSRLITPITHIVTLIIPIMNILTKSP